MAAAPRACGKAVCGKIWRAGAGYGGGAFDDLGRRDRPIFEERVAFSVTGLGIIYVSYASWN